VKKERQIETDALLYPDANRSQQILGELSHTFSQHDFVRRVLASGSLARGEQDRWSDIDIIVVTVSSTQFWPLFTDLCQIRPVLYRDVFTHDYGVLGSHILGIVFAGESVFHCLDLNFLTQAEYDSPHCLDRFGATRHLYESTKWDSTDEWDTAQQLEREKDNPDARRIAAAVHWTKKAIKKVLRGQAHIDEVRATSAQLTAALADSPTRIPWAGGDLCAWARTYSHIAERLMAMSGTKADREPTHHSSEVGDSTHRRTGPPTPNPGGVVKQNRG
jgi:predicted nucleotidyltransferase